MFSADVKPRFLKPGMCQRVQNYRFALVQCTYVYLGLILVENMGEYLDLIEQA
jgi:hypothetical protein